MDTDIFKQPQLRPLQQPKQLLLYSCKDAAMLFRIWKAMNKKLIPIKLKKENHTHIAKRMTQLSRLRIPKLQ